MKMTTKLRQMIASGQTAMGATAYDDMNEAKKFLLTLQNRLITGPQARSVGRMVTQWVSKVGAVLVLTLGMTAHAEYVSLQAPESRVDRIATGFKWTEGLAADAEGNLFFVDIPNAKIHKWSLDGKLTTLRSDLQLTNGMFFDRAGNLIVCQDNPRRLISISPAGEITTVVDSYRGGKFNQPNDLWIEPQAGGIFFTDPLYGQLGTKEIDGKTVGYLAQPNIPGGGMVFEKDQPGEYVYYVSPDRKQVTAVATDLKRPNGIVGSADGKTLYVADAGTGGVGIVYSYAIGKDGTLTDKAVFAVDKADGMTIDEEGNVYLASATGVVPVYNRSGRRIDEIRLPERPVNMTFGGKDRRTLFVGTQNSVYAVPMRVGGAREAVTLGKDH